MAKKDVKGITASKEGDFSEWFTQLIQKAELIEYSPVSGCYILRPAAYGIWEKVQSYLDSLLKKEGVQNVYFPLFIPESLLLREKEHVEGFAPEVAWVEKGGQTDLSERLAVRPTSETIMYDAYAKWIRSHKDLPLRLNQWCNVVRWEFKHCTPFLRSREFLWQEGHTAFASKQEAVVETRRILDLYEQVFRELYAVPVLKGLKSENEKFAGADFTLSVEAFLPNGKAIQGATSHHLGQNFAKAFNITFTDEKQQMQHAWQNSWGFTTRTIGIVVMMHSDDRGLVLPPLIAPFHAVLVPIFFDESKKKVLQETKKLAEKLEKAGFTTHVDDREEYSPGWKFNEWEMKGIPLRIELGPKDLEKKQVVLVRRDVGSKKGVAFADLVAEVRQELKSMQDDLYKKAKRNLDKSIVSVHDLKEAVKQLTEDKIIYAPFCGRADCENTFKEKTGAKSLNSPFEQASVSGKACFACGQKAERWFYFGKSY